MQTRVEEEGERTGDVSDEEWDGCDINEVDRDQDRVGSHDVLSPLNRHTRHDSKYANNQNEEDALEWETYPAVGGGVISRPRVYHSQSQIRAPSESGAMPSPGTGSVTARASSIGGASSTIGVSLRSLSYKRMKLTMFRVYANSLNTPPHLTIKHKRISDKPDPAHHPSDA
jgi:distribution and morphology protein 34